MGEEKEETSFPTSQEIFDRIVHLSRVRGETVFPSYEEMKAEIKKERKERRVGNLLAFAIIVGYAVLAVVTWVLFSYDNPGELIIGCALVFGIILGMYILQLFRWMDEFKKNMKVE